MATFKMYPFDKLTVRSTAQSGYTGGLGVSSPRWIELGLEPILRLLNLQLCTALCLIVCSVFQGSVFFFVSKT
jgi:hypothetical protein